MSKKYNKDYMALQNIWSRCAMDYINCMSPEIRIKIVEDFKQSLVDIKPDGEKALFTRYIEWESNEWINRCKDDLKRWRESNHFESVVPENVVKEFENIKMDLNYLRFHKIMQIIQDSGIGLGSGKERGHYELSGYMGETTE